MTNGTTEANFDGLVGPTHNYAGLSWGNVASRAHGGRVSHPRSAALQGLDKMRHLASLGLVQGVLPPHERPAVQVLRRLGFTGNDGQVLAQAQAADPIVLATCCSASGMWAANAATVAPSPDTTPGRVHLTPSNLVATLHRALEPSQTGRALRRIFPGELFVHHDPLPATVALGDEGAANHTRLAADGTQGVHLFVYGRRGSGGGPSPTRFPARQTREASEAVARLHRLDPGRCLFVQQNPEVIDEGVFHNDVIAVGHGHVLLFHERAFVDTPSVIEELRRLLGGALVPLCVRSSDLSVADAVKSYLFNSQLVTLPDGSMAIIAPTECQDADAARTVLEQIVADSANPIGAVHYLDVRQSMQNGGGPACLRLRVPLTEHEVSAVHPPCLYDDALHDRLAAWVRRHYREELEPKDLADPRLLDESRAALDELTSLLELGSDFYPFQS